MRGDIKRLMAILRIPRLCSEFHRIANFKLDKKENKKADKEAYRLLATSIGGESEHKFMKDLINDIENKYPQLKLQKQDTNEVG